MRSRRFGVLGTFCAASAFAALASGKPSSTGAPPTRTPSPSAIPAVPQSETSTADARALFERVVASLGGKEKILKIRDVRTRGQVTARTPQGEMTMEMETTLVFPDHLSQVVDAPFGRFVMVATPAGAFVVGNQGAQDLPSEMRAELLRQVQRAAFYLAQKADDPRLTLRTSGEEKVGDVTTRVLDVSYPDVTVRWFVDPATGRVLRSAHDSRSTDGSTVRVVSEYSDFRNAEGFTLPHRLELVTEGSPDQTLVLEEVKINGGVDPKIFEKPPAPTPRPTSRPGG